MVEMAGSVGGGGDQGRIAIDGGEFSTNPMSIKVDTLPVAGCAFVSDH